MMEEQRNVVYGVNGPVVTVRDTKSFFMQEMVLVGKEHLVGEVIRVTSKETLIQVYEETTGVRPGDPVEPAGVPLSVTLGPGLVGDILDGIDLGDTEVEIEEACAELETELKKKKKKNLAEAS